MKSQNETIILIIAQIIRRIIDSIDRPTYLQFSITISPIYLTIPPTRNLEEALII